MNIFGRSSRSKGFVVVAGCLAALAGHAASDPLSPLDFLLGSWRSSDPDVGGSDAFRRDLDGHILQRRSESSIMSGGQRRSMRTYLTIYPSADYAGFDALYLDNLGHVILYDVVTVVPGRSAQFTSASSASSPSFRLSYVLKTPSVLHVTFEMAPPGQPAVYETIAEADEIQKRPAARR